MSTFSLPLQNKTVQQYGLCYVVQYICSLTLFFYFFPVYLLNVLWAGCHFPGGSSHFCEVLHIFAVLQVCISSLKLQAFFAVCIIIRQTGCKGLITPVVVTLPQHISHCSQIK